MSDENLPNEQTEATQDSQIGDAVSAEEVAQVIERVIPEAVEVVEKVEPLPEPVVEATDAPYVPTINKAFPDEVYSNKNVTVDKEYAKEIDETLPGKRLVLGNTDSMDRIVSLLEQIAANNTKESVTEALASWMEKMTLSGQALINNDAFKSSLLRENGDWRQGVDFEGISYRMEKPVFNNKQGNGAVISGTQAVYHVNNLMKRGAIVNVPLWTTGIWLTLKSPKNSDLLELDQRLTELKVNLGSSSVGLLFSNDTAFLVMEVVNMVLRHVIDASVHDHSVSALKKLILTADIPALIWGFASAIYTEGYPLVRPCSNPICKHEDNFMLKLNLLSFVDNNQLTHEQRKHMTRSRTKVEVSEIKDYQAMHKWIGVNDFTTLKDGVLRIKYKVPNLHEYEVSAHDWIDGIVNTMESSLKEPLTGQARLNYITKQATLTMLRQYAHWINNITTKDEAVIEDSATLATILEHLSGDDEVDDAFFDSIAKFIDITAINIIGIPKYPCSKCKTLQVDVDPKHPMLIALDPVDLFFTLMTQRIGQTLA